MPTSERRLTTSIHAAYDIALVAIFLILPLLDMKIASEKRDARIFNLSPFSVIKWTLQTFKDEAR